MKNIKAILVLLGMLIVLAFLTPIVFASGVGVSGSGVGGMPSSPTFSGTVSSTKPCAAGFMRLTPNYCTSTIENKSAFATVSTCQLSSAITGVTNAKAINIQVQSIVLSTNVLGAQDGITVRYFLPTDTTCTSTVVTTSYVVREWVAVAAATVFSAYAQLTIPSDTSGRFYRLMYSGTAGSGASALVLGYYD